MAIFRWLKATKDYSDFETDNFSTLIRSDVNQSNSAFPSPVWKCHRGNQFRLWPSVAEVGKNRISCLTFVASAYYEHLSRCLRQWLSFSHTCWLIRHWSKPQKKELDFHSLVYAAPDLVRYAARIRNRAGDINLTSARNAIRQASFSFISRHIWSILTRSFMRGPFMNWYDQLSRSCECKL